MRLIDADALYKDCLERLKRFDVSDFAFKNCFPFWIFHEAITEAPTIEASAVRHGRWEHGVWQTYPDGYVCDRCSTGYAIPYNYCPHCGAKMDGGVEDG